MDVWGVDEPSVHLWMYELEAHESVHFYCIITSLEINNYWASSRSGSLPFGSSLIL